MPRAVTPFRATGGAAAGSGEHRIPRSRDVSNRPVRAGTPHDTARPGDGEAVVVPLAVDERDETVVRRRSRGFRMISATFLLDIAGPCRTALATARGLDADGHGAPRLPACSRQCRSAAG